MTVKVLVTSIGQHIVSEVKQVEQKETKEVIAYWLINPRVVTYNVTEDDQVNVNFGQYCLVSSETEFSLKSEHVVSILEPREEVKERYELVVGTNETEETEEETDAASYASAEDGPHPDLSE